jgi:transmembrane sensor
MTTEEEQLTGNAQKVVELIRERMAVRWPPGHVEIALIQVQRKRQQRRAITRATALGVCGMALFLSFGGASRVYDLASSVAPDWFSPASHEAAPAPAPGVTPAPVVAAKTTAAPADSAPAVTFGPAEPARGAAAETAPREGHLLQQRLVPRRTVAAARWMALAEQKRFGEAYGLLRQVPLRDLAGVDDLMLAADVARQAGRPERAVPFLERVVKEHPTEVRAQLAGFSLGKIYLDNLDEPVLAARNFAAVRGMAPSGGLAQDALAREVEAWARAGMSSRAHDAALEYVRLYPNGRRVAAVRDLGRI